LPLAAFDRHSGPGNAGDVDRAEALRVAPAVIETGPPTVMPTS
jgi:hypothetical protein